MNKNIRLIVRQALIAGLYVCFTLINPLSFSNIQIRISEIFVLLCFYKKEYIIGLTLGCFIANLFSPMLIYDITIGVTATVLSCIIVYLSKNIYVASIFPVLINGFLIGLELYLALELPYIISVLEVMAGEIIVMVIAIIVFKAFERNQKLMYYITLDEKYR